MAINFPANPSDNDLFVANQITYIYDATKGYWRVSSDADTGNDLTLANLNVTSTFTGSGLTYPTTDGTSGQAIVTDGSGNLSFTTISGGSGVPGGSNNQVQYNDNGSFAGSDNLTFDGTNLFVENLDLTSNNESLAQINVSGDANSSVVTISNYEGGVLGTAVTIDETGGVTASSFSGNGANLTNINYSVTQNDVTQHQAALSITESQISDLQSYLTSETNDLTASVTWANIPDANVPESAVTQHQAALSITESQISDLQSYLTAESDTLDSVTGRGNVTVNDIGAGNITGISLTTAGKVQFPNNAANPTYQEGALFYDQTAKALSYYNDEADVTLQIGQEQYVRVYNNTGSTIPNGAPVYLSGEINGIPTAALADATDEIKASAVGLATHSIENATFGYITVNGIVFDVDTSGLTQGARVHVSPTAGSLQTASPTYPYYATDVGICLISDALNGCIYIDIQQHHAETFRTSGNASFDGNVRIGGDLTILGTQSTIQVSTIRVDDNIIYLNGGNAIAPEDITFTGTGLNDLIFNDYYEGNDAGTTYYVRIDGVGTGTGGVDTFEWSIDNFSTTEATGVDITGDDQPLSNNIKANFNATTGHTLNDTWEATATPSNVDIGFMGNRNTGASGGGYSHVGFFFDTADETFKAFKEYAPDPIGGNINASDPSFVLGDIAAGTLSGDLTGNVTGNVTGNASTATSLATARNITLTGDVTGSLNQNFDGTADVSINTSLSATYLTDITGETLTSLSDVNAAAPSDGQVLTYNNTTGNWEAQTPSGGGGGGGSFLPTKLDPITVVNGQDTYNLEVLNSAYTPSSINALLVSLNGVTQSPGDAFTISGSTITFIPAPVTGDVIDFIIDLGAAVETVSTTETDTLNSVTTRGAATTNEITVGGLTSTGKYVETVGTLSGSTPSLAATNGTIVTWTLPGNSTPTDGLSSGEFLTLHIDNSAAATITWPTIAWTRGTAPELSTTNINVIHVWKVGANLYGAALGELA